MSRRFFRPNVLNFTDLAENSTKNESISTQESNIIVRKVASEHEKEVNYQKEMYGKYLKKFLEEDCEYEYQHLTSVIDLKDAYRAFIHRYKNELSKCNCGFKLKPTDIPLVDNRYQYKLITCCVYCRKRKFANCCADYTNYKNTKITFIVNLKLKTNPI